MNIFRIGNTLGILSLALVLPFALGCGQSQKPQSETASHEDEHGHDDHEHGEEGHNLHGFWCAEHGVPEKICGQCYPKLAAEYQKKGDWCEEHKRPNSQCFIHHPEFRDQFIAQYEAKFGEKPPVAKAD